MTLNAEVDVFKTNSWDFLSNNEMDVQPVHISESIARCEIVIKRDVRICDLNLQSFPFPNQD